MKEDDLPVQLARLESLFLRWGATDPLWSLQQTRLLPEDIRGFCVNAVLRGWVTVDSGAAWAWATESVAGISRANAMQTKRDRFGGMLDELMKLGRWTDGAYLLSNSHDDDYRLVLSWQFGERWAKFDSSGALAWYRGIEDEILAVNVLAGVVSSLASHDPEAATKEILAIEGGSEKVVSLLSILLVWTERHDLASAEVWLEGLNIGRLRDPLVAEFACAAARQGMPDRAPVWIARIEDDGMRESAAKSVFSLVVSESPEIAARLVVSYYSEGVRESALLRAMRSWRQTDRTGATEFVTRSELLSARERELCLEELGRLSPPG